MSTTRANRTRLATNRRATRTLRWMNCDGTPQTYHESEKGPWKLCPLAGGAFRRAQWKRGLGLPPATIGSPCTSGNCICNSSAPSPRIARVGREWGRRIYPNAELTCQSVLFLRQDQIQERVIESYISVSGQFARSTSSSLPKRFRLSRPLRRQITPLHALRVTRLPPPPGG